MGDLESYFNKNPTKSQKYNAEFIPLLFYFWNQDNKFQKLCFIPRRPFKSWQYYCSNHPYVKIRGVNYHVQVKQSLLRKGIEQI